MKPNTELVLTALALPGVGRRTVVKVGNAVRATGDESLWTTILAKHHSSTVETAKSTAHGHVATAERLGLTVLTIMDDDYPERLRTIDDPPACLFVRGTTAILHSSDAVAVVGTREPSTYAITTARSSAKYLASKGAVVVSGLAKGCDTLAHEGCLDGHGHTVAVLAHGLEKVYPAENRGLAERIVANGGALVSEYPVGTPAQRNSFVERDRLQSGLSDTVLVIETSESGGSMHTARFAYKQDRILATMEHPTNYASDPRTEGNEQIKREMGGVPVKSKDDLHSLLITYRLSLLAAFLHHEPEKALELLGDMSDSTRIPSDLTTRWIRLVRNTLAHPNAALRSESSALVTSVNDEMLRNRLRKLLTNGGSKADSSESRNSNVSLSQTRLFG